MVPWARRVFDGEQDSALRQVNERGSAKTIEELIPLKVALPLRQFKGMAAKHDLRPIKPRLGRYAMRVQFTQRCIRCDSLNNLLASLHERHQVWLPLVDDEAEPVPGGNVTFEVAEQNGYVAARRALGLRPVDTQE
jgi:hypothetical protein